MIAQVCCTLSWVAIPSSAEVQERESDVVPFRWRVNWGASNDKAKA